MFFRALLITAASLSAFAQTAPPKPEFDAVSIKPSPPGTAGGMIRVGCNGGPGTKDPGLFTCTNMNAFNLVTRAYSMDGYRVAGIEYNQDMFEISARVPAGATKDDFDLMLQAMLTDRFHLAVHHEMREITKYDMVIAKNGPKFKKAAEAPPVNPEDPPKPPPPGAGRMQTDASGLPVLTPGQPGMAMNGKGARMFNPRMTMDRLAGQMGGQMGKPVTNATDLEGEYEIALFWAPDSMSANKPEADSAETLPTLTRALQEQLGLRLEQKKGPIDFLVVDHIDKMPASN